jgi:hypothetical protein
MLSDLPKNLAADLINFSENIRSPTYTFYEGKNV